jgi:hypothetical protein
LPAHFNPKEKMTRTKAVWIVFIIIALALLFDNLRITASPKSVIEQITSQFPHSKILARTGPDGMHNTDVLRDERRVRDGEVYILCTFGLISVVQARIADSGVVLGINQTQGLTSREGACGEELADLQKDSEDLLILKAHQAGQDPLLYELEQRYPDLAKMGSDQKTDAKPTKKK